MKPRILYLQYSDPAVYPPIVHGTRILADAGWDVLLFHGQSPRNIPMRPKEGVRHVTIPACGPGLFQKAHFLWFTVRAALLCAWTHPLWVYASDPMATPAALLCRLTGARVLYHEHDAPDATAARSVFAKFLSGFRRTLARRADFCVLPNAERARIFSSETGCADPLVVWNCPERYEVGAPRVPLAADSLKVFYHGSLGPACVPIAVLDAIASLPEAVTFCALGYDTGGRTYSEELKKRSRELGISARVEILDAAAREEFLVLCGRCDVGLSLMPVDDGNVNHRHMAGASNKAFEYLGRGLALLVSDLPDWRRSFVDGGYAVACDPRSAESVATALRWCLDHPAEVRVMGERGRRKVIDDWNYENTFAPVLARLEARRDR